MEYSTFIDLPDDRCGFSDRGHTCVWKAWHGGFHRMVPSSWIQHERAVPGAPAHRADVQALRPVAEVVEHKHSWGPFGCWCGASQHAVMRSYGIGKANAGAGV
jgi:hypothetical protein